jgi:hypothetical protein
MDERLQSHPSDRSAARRSLRGALIALAAILAFVLAPGAAFADSGTPDGAPEQTPVVEQQTPDPAADPQPQEAQPTVDTPPADTTPPVDTPPADTTTADTPPVDTPPVDAPPADTPPADTPPVDAPPVDTPPADTPPADTPPVDTPPADTPPVDTPPADTPPVDTPPADSPATPPADAPPADRPTAVDPPADTPPGGADTPPADTPADDAPADDRRDTRPIDTSAPAAMPKLPSGSGTLRPVISVADPVTTTQSDDPPVATAQDAAPTLGTIVVAPVTLPSDKHTDHAAAAAADAAARDAAAKRIVHTTLVRLGIVSADPVTTRTPTAPVASGGDFCAPVVVSSATPTPASGTTRLQVTKSPRKQRGGQQPANVRGPPVGPLDSPSSPLTASAAAAPGSGSAAGISFFAILVGSVSAQLAQAEAVAPPCSFASNSATPTSDDSARAPPAS